MSSFKGNIYWDGEGPRIQTREKFVEWLKQFPEDQWFSFEVTPLGSVNSSSQRNLYFKWCDIIAEEYGWDSGTELHEYFKDTYNNGKSTKGFTVKEWSEYMIKVQAFAHQHNINLPIGNAT